MINPAFTKIWREVFKNTFNSVIGPLLVGIAVGVIGASYIALMLLISVFIHNILGLHPVVDAFAAVLFFIASMGFGALIVVVTHKALERYSQEQDMIMRTLKGTKTKYLKDDF